MTNYLSESKMPYFISQLYGNIPVASHDEVDGLYKKYVKRAINPPTPKKAYVYYYDGNTLHFSNEPITNHGSHTLTDSYEIELGEASDPMWIPPWINMYTYEPFYVKAITTSGRFTPTESTAHWFGGMYYLEDIECLANWDMSPVVSTFYMFSGCTAIKDLSSLSNWDVSSLENMGNMFSQMNGLTSVEALSSWDTSSVTNMGGVFANSSRIETFTPLDGWDVSNVTNHTNMFLYTTGTRPVWATDSTWG